MKLGRFNLFYLTDGTFRLDGGAMFGVVPKVIWQKECPADSLNRILLALGVLLIQADGKNILVDTGIGNKGNPKFNDIYQVNRSPFLEAELKKHGLTPDSIDIVINTHLHFDHAGGNTRINSSGELAPGFPNARYYIQRKEWEFAFTLNERTKGSYLLENYSLLEKTGQLVFLDGDQDILEGVAVVETPGHTEHHQSIVVSSEKQKACFLGDLIPTTAHLSPPYIMGYDLFPLTTLQTKKKILQQAHEERWLLFFQHDPKIRSGYLKEKNGKFILDPAEE
ncbi:MAG: MBL fold metallo-hydrolase [Nitrospirae bacterium]|nr:MBL fold metallo-hydrolase [Nitrospirota bacterium]